MTEQPAQRKTGVGISLRGPGRLFAPDFQRAENRLSVWLVEEGGGYDLSANRLERRFGW
jgi:hypothetical protein